MDDGSVGVNGSGESAMAGAGRWSGVREGGLEREREREGRDQSAAAIDDGSVGINGSGESAMAGAGRWSGVREGGLEREREREGRGGIGKLGISEAESGWGLL
ncbi:hypothetical protein V6N12_042015 [Hibiscus sabdariffa]|uniref:Uncharacterized protein n=1 Tax=Hibiscus sabdariffa TaxID=183260 RepID=A0ABR2EH61_9ROSI